MANIKDVFDIEELEKHVEQGLVSKRKHPNLPLYIYNYTPECAFANEWNEITMTCRGLILDADYNIVARPFRKFFNLNTSFRPETHLENLPKVRPTITEKMDGSLGIYWSYNGQHGVATRGSFTSDQAIWATKYYDIHFGKDYRWEGVTPLFEIIYPQNRIVLDYGRNEYLVLIGLVNISDGQENTYEQMEHIGFPYMPKIYRAESLEDCVSASNTDAPVNMEGYVLRYDTGRYPLRVKIKFAEYLRLHRLIFSLNSRRVWESLSSGKDPLADIDVLPDDAFQWMTHVANGMQLRYDYLLKKAELVFHNRPCTGDRKDDALYFQQYPEVQGICFALLDAKDIGPIIWHIIKPKKAEIFRGAVYDEQE